MYHEFLACVSDVILKIKTDVKNPYTILAGDVNKKRIDEAIGDYPDMTVITTGATRGNAVLDEVATSFSQELVGVEAHDPVKTPDGCRSDHVTTTYKFHLAHSHKFKCIRYSARHVTEEGLIKQEQRVRETDWEAVVGKADVHTIAESLHRQIMAIRHECFPLRHYKNKLTNDPWIDEATLKMIERRQGVFFREGWSVKWKDIKAKTKYMISERKRKYFEKETRKLTEEGAHRTVWKALKNLFDAERTPAWCMDQLFPGEDVETMAERLADYFAAVLNEYDPVNPASVPVTYKERAEEIGPPAIISRMAEMRKPSSTVAIDPLPKHVDIYTEPIARVLSRIVNRILCVVNRILCGQD